MPIWLTFVLMVLAAYRLSRLIVRDTFPPVLWVRDRLAGGWRPMTPEEKAAGMIPPQDVDFGHGLTPAVYRKRASWSPYWLAELLSCTWCASGWISGAVTAAVAITVGLPSPWLVGPAVWGASAWILSQE
jgi:hypothetical protein